MNEKTKKALEESIIKWEDILAGTEGDNGIENCALCQEFYCAGNCTECLVKEKTDIGGCLNTPYDGWARHHENHHNDRLFPDDTRIKCPTCQGYANKELEFLKSLRDD